MNTAAEDIVTGKITIERSIFHDDTLSPIWFVFSLKPFSKLSNNIRYGFNIKSGRENLITIDHWLFMNGIETHAANQSHLDDTSRPVWIACKTLNIIKERTA